MNVSTSTIPEHNTHKVVVPRPEYQLVGSALHRICRLSVSFSLLIGVSLISHYLSLVSHILCSLFVYYLFPVSIVSHILCSFFVYYLFPIFLLVSRTLSLSRYSLNIFSSLSRVCPNTFLSTANMLFVHRHDRCEHVAGHAGLCVPVLIRGRHVCFW